MVFPIVTVYTVSPFTLLLINVQGCPQTGNDLIRIEAPVVDQAAAISISMFTADAPQQLSISMFTADVTGWSRVTDFLHAADKTKVFNSSDWVAVERAALLKKIAKDGYTPENLAKAKALIGGAAAGTPVRTTMPKFR